jgi:hypothetical protein
LPPEDEGLMPQHQKLDVFGEPAASPSEEQLQDRRESEISEGEQHSTMLPELTTGRSQTNPSLNVRQSVAKPATTCYSHAREEP